MTNKFTPPYNLMWHAAPYGPVFGDIGIGIGLMKVASNMPKSQAINPAYIKLDLNTDEKARRWMENSCNQAMGGLENDLPVDSELKFICREWHPDSLTSFYQYKGVDVQQETVTTRDGSHCCIKSGKEIITCMGGVSHGPCKVTLTEKGLHVIENHPVLCPMEYTVSFSTPPSKVTCGDIDIRENQVLIFPGKTVWIFTWSTPQKDLEISVDTQRSFSPLMEQIVPLSKDGSAKIAGLKHKTFAQHKSEQRQSWGAFFAHDVPVIECPDPRVEQLNQYLAWVFHSNTIQHGGILPYPYSMPKQTFVGWWMWDTAKSAIAGSWYGRREAAWGGMLNIECLQYPADVKDAGVVTNSARYNGVDCWWTEHANSNRTTMMPYLIHTMEEHGSGTHPPMMSLALWSLWTVDGNDKLMQRMLSNALAMDKYFETIRASETVPGLLLVRRWSDSGMDNSKRWGNQGNRALRGEVHYDDVDWEMPVISVDVNVYNIREKQCLAEMCRAVGWTKEAERLEREARQREDILHRELWDSEKGFYFDRDEARGKFTYILSPTGMSPLMLKNLPGDRIEPLLSYLYNEEHFWGEYPIPSIAKSDPGFETAGGYWMGPVWFSYPVDILRGLTYHNHEAACKLLDKLMNLMLPGGEPAINENYEAISGTPIECPNFSWNGQVMDVLFRNMFGITMENGSPKAESTCLPEDWDHWSIKNIMLHGKRYNISAKKSGGRWQHDIEEI